MPAFPYLAKATIKYKSPHKQDLTFAKGETIRVTGVAPKTEQDDEDDDDDDDWLVGETLDGTRSGIFPGSFVEPSDEAEQAPTHEADAKIAEATSASTVPGAIPTEVPDQLKSSVVEEPPSHQAETVPKAAREAAQKGETEQAGFGAPLPPRPPSPDEDEDQVAEPIATQASSAQTVTGAETASDSTAGAGDVPKAAAGGAAAAVGIATGVAAAAVMSDAPKADKASSISTSPVKSPPAVATKPAGMSNSFRDRLAAFNKPADSAPPPLPKGKPGGWKRPTPASTEAKPLIPGAPAPASSAAASKPAAAPATQPTETSAAPTSSEASSGGGGGGGAFSAADAQTSIKMSLKERMAALQRNEAAAAESAPQLKPKPSVPGKIGADRRNVAMQGMGLAPGASVPVRKSSVESGRSTDEPVGENPPTREGSGADTTAVPSEEVGQDASASATKDAGAVEERQEPTKESGEPKEELTEEEQEAERRAAIAKRMAALGARRMGGAPVPFGAPAPPNRTKTTSSIGSAEGTTSEPGIAIPTESPAQASSREAREEAAPTTSAAAAVPGEGENADIQSPISGEADEEPKVLAVPRRTAAPRKRKPVAQTAAVAAGAAAVEGEDLAGGNDTAPPAGAAPTADSVTDHSEVAAADPDEPARATTEEAEAAEAGLDDEVGLDTTATHSADASHTQASVDVALHQDATGEQLEDSDPEIAETQRQLEEYLRGEGFYEDQVEAPAEHEPEAASADPAAPASEAEPEPVPAQEAVPREDVTSPKPPSRPASTRPPVPRTSLPPPPLAAGHDDPVAARVQSPSVPAIPTSLSRPASVLPPVPTSALPVPVETADEETNDSEPETHEVQQETGPVLAAPKPRMAVATEDPEDEELLAAADTPATTEEEHIEASGAIAEELPEEQELTEEEQEAQRRANLARRMAALGGQRIGAFPGMAPPPIMGAPMPARKAPVQAAEETEDVGREAEEGFEQEKPLSPIRGPPRGGMAIPGLTAVPGMNAEQAEGDALERAKSPGAASVDAPARLASPPPVPTSVPSKPTSPPPPARPLPTAGSGESTLPPTLPPGRPSSTAPMPNLDEAIRSTSPANSSLGRRGSMKPPVPQGFRVHSRESSAVAEQEAAEDQGLATSPPPLPVSPPPLPVSPPPRPSSRAPPLPGLASVPPRRQGSSASYASVGESVVPSSATATPAAELPSSAVPPPRTEASLPPTPAASSAPSNINVGARQSSRDLDLMPSSRWWRHGVNPLRLPPTVAGRPDAILYADTSSSTDTGVVVHRADIYMLFEDYSTTVISLSFQEDDLEETHTSLTQRHNFAPSKPSSGELKQWSSSIGSGIAKLASDAAKQSSAPVGDGSARAFVQHILASVPHALPAVGTSLGALLLTQVGPTVMDTGADEIRPGDLVFASQADFKGKKGLAPYHTMLGATEPTTGIVVDVESKKNKLRCIIQSPSTRKGLPEELSLRLDDLKSGIVKAFRVPPRHGWVADW